MASIGVAERTSRGARFVVAGLLVGGPILITLLTAFGLLSPAASASSGFTFDHIREVLTGGDLFGGLMGTLVVALGGASVAVVLGTLLATIATRLNVPGMRNPVLRWLPIVSFLFSPVLVLLAWHTLYADRAGMVNVFLRAITGQESNASGPLNILTVPFVVAAMGVAALPFVYLPVQSALRSASTELEQAALVFGASWFRVLRTVTIPLVKGSIIAGGLLALVIGLGAYIVPAAIRIPGFQTASLSMRADLMSSPPRYEQAAAWSIILLVLCFMALIVLRYVIKTQASALPLRSSSSKGELGLQVGAARWPLFAIYLFISVMISVLPLLGVINLALRRFWSTDYSLETLTLNNFTRIGDIAPIAFTSLRNAMVVSLIAGGLSIVLGLWFARQILSPSPWSKLLEGLTFLPAGIPPLIVGLSFLMFSLRVVPSSYATFIPPTLALIVVFLPLTVQISLAALRRIPAELQQASAVFGASKLSTTRRVVLPLLVPEVLALWTLLTIAMLREVDASVMLSIPRYALAGPQLLNIWEDGAPVAAAFGLIIFAATLCLIALGGIVAFLFRGAQRLSAWSRLREVARLDLSQGDLVATQPPVVRQSAQ